MSATNSVDPVFAVPQYPTLALRHLRFGRNNFFGMQDSRRFDMYLGRFAIFHAIRSLHAHPGHTVLVPAYICKTAVDPIVAAGASVECYAVNRRCEIDFDDLRGRINDDTVAMVAVHYFGFPAELDRLRDLCNEYGIALIEDCAHVLCGTYDGKPLGTFGDYALHSWRKFLPLFDGGDLLVNHAARAPEGIPTRVPRRVVMKSMRHLLSAIPWLAAARKYLSSPPGDHETDSLVDAPVQPSETDAFETYTDEFNEHAAFNGMSWPSRFFLRHFDSERVASARSKNYEYLQKRLAGCPGIVPLHDKPPPGGAAWIFPAIVADQPDAHKILRQLGIPATAWDGVRPDQVGGGFPDAEFLYHHLVFLPIHQGLTLAHLDSIVEACQMLSSKRASSPV